MRQVLLEMGILFPFSCQRESNPMSSRFVSGEFPATVKELNREYIPKMRFSIFSFSPVKFADHFWLTFSETSYINMAFVIFFRIKINCGITGG